MLGPQSVPLARTRKQLLQAKQIKDKKIEVLRQKMRPRYTSMAQDTEFAMQTSIMSIAEISQVQKRDLKREAAKQRFLCRSTQPVEMELLLS